MTFGYIREQVLFQTQNDADDLEDYQPAIDDYINEGYDRLIYAYTGMHLDETNDSETTIPYPSMSDVRDEPKLPKWTHRAIADYATYLMYRNGNALKQSRGVPYYNAFMEVLNKLPYAKKGGMKFKNLFVEKVF